MTVLLCGSSEFEVDNIQHQFINCFHRLHWATATSSTSDLLPGGGRTETSCIAMLEREATRTQHSDSDINSHDSTNKHLPAYFSHSWMAKGTPKVVERTESWVWRVHQAFANGLRHYVTRTIMNCRPDLGQYEAMSVLEEMLRGGKMEEEVGKMVLDVCMCKEEAWSRAVRLLEIVFFSVKFETSTLSVTRT